MISGKVVKRPYFFGRRSRCLGHVESHTQPAGAVGGRVEAASQQGEGMTATRYAAGQVAVPAKTQTDAADSQAGGLQRGQGGQLAGVIVQGLALDLLARHLDLLLLELEDHLEEVAHRQHHLAGRLVRLDAEEPMAAVRRPKDVAERPRIGHVLGNERDLVDGMVVQRVARLLIPQPQPIDGHMNRYPLLVLAGCPYGHLEVLQRLLAHPVSSRLAHLQNADELGLELNAIAEKSSRIIAI